MWIAQSPELIQHQHICTIADYCITGSALLLLSSILSLTSRWAHEGWELQRTLQILYEMHCDSNKVHVSWININTLIIPFHCTDAAVGYAPRCKKEERWWTLSAGSHSSFYPLGDSQSHHQSLKVWRMDEQQEHKHVRTRCSHYDMDIVSPLSALLHLSPALNDRVVDHLSC